jgi:hypothetical protein
VTLDAINSIKSYEQRNMCKEACHEDGGRRRPAEPSCIKGVWRRGECVSENMVNHGEQPEPRIPIELRGCQNSKS